MNLLAIDTSTELASVALSVRGNVFCEEQDGFRQHAQLLLPMIQRLLVQADYSLQNFDAIVFGCGPGSFTGLRIACSIAKSLAYAYDLPLYPISSLAAIAHQVFQTETDSTSATNVLAMIDARMQQVYWANFTKDLVEAKEQVTSASDVELIPSTPLILAGVGFELYVSQLPEAVQASMVKQRTIFPSAKSMIQLVESGKFNSVTAAEALPVYVRNQVTQGESRG